VGRVVVGTEDVVVVMVEEDENSRAGMKGGEGKGDDSEGQVDAVVTTRT
jgi:hypothetical protein